MIDVTPQEITMNTPKKLMLAVVCALALPFAAVAGDGMPGCAREPDAKAIQSQNEKMDHCMRRMKDAKTPAERQKAMDEHMKEMQAGMGRMGGKHSMGCHGEMMDHMMDHMKQHRAAMQESGG
ncbi:hypothetical protein BWI17_21900 [Betaproteobacteria bacterium GR16-43]|nr:hypothetical protein BWI17_21900 [Betaproteobacteria bacterium GR16-43]